MKKKFKFSLDLNKESVSELTRKQQSKIFGGNSDACPPVSTECPEETAPTNTCDCPDLPTNDRFCGYTWWQGHAGCEYYTTVRPGGTTPSPGTCA